MNSNPADIQTRLQQLHREYARQLPQKIGELSRIWAELSAGGSPSAERLQEMVLLCHRLAGSAASFGFAEVTEHSRHLEHHLQQARESGAVFPDNLLQEVGRLLHNLQELAAIPPVAPDLGVAPEPARSAPAGSERLIYILFDHDEQATLLAAQLRNYGYTIELFEQLDLLEQQLQQQPPSTLVLCLALDDRNLELLERFKPYAEELPLILVTDNSETRTRLAAVRNGISAYFTKPMDIVELVDTVDRLHHHESREPYRVLVIDDSQPAAEFYTYHLQQAGMDVRYLTEPMQIMDVINSFSPELILMDLYMPGCSGSELSDLVRQQESNLGTPIVFLSSENDLEKQLAVIRHGDDFLTKPIRADHLVAAVSSRARRFRELRAMMLKDSLTGLYNHTTLADMLFRELQQARRDGTVLSYIMLDIDHFKSVNDVHGHSAGDRIIKSLSRLLRQRVRRNDYVGRYGGEEFAIIMPNTEARDALKVIDDIRCDFAGLKHLSEAKMLSCTFSAGVADNRMTEDAGSLTRAADAALYRAKQQGRNRCVLADSVKK